jgi:hypothetical protein
MAQVITTYQHLENVSNDATQPIGMRVLALLELYHLTSNNSVKEQYIRTIDFITRETLAKSTQQI